MTSAVSPPFALIIAGPLPPWVPPAGNVGAIAGPGVAGLTSTIESVAAPPGVHSGHAGPQALFTTWNSGGFSPHYSALGGYFIAGGGDGGYEGTEGYVFDLSTRIWNRVSLPCAALSGNADADRQRPPGDPLRFDPTYGEHGDGTPCAPQYYDCMEYLPPNLGGGSKGSLISPVRHVFYKIFRTKQAHKLNLAAAPNEASNRAWSRASSNLSELTNNCDSPSWCFDAARGVYWGFEADGGAFETSKLFQLDMSQGTGVGVHRSFPMPAHYMLRAYPCSRYWPTKGRIVLFGLRHDIAGFPGAIRVYDPNAASSGYIEVATSGDSLPANTSGSGMAYCDDLDCFFLRSTKAGDGQKVWQVSPPAQWQSQPWLVRRLTMNGATVQDDPQNGCWKRLSYVRSIKSLIWCSSWRGNVFAYRPIGL